MPNKCSWQVSRKCPAIAQLVSINYAIHVQEVRNECSINVQTVFNNRQESIQEVSNKFPQFQTVVREVYKQVSKQCPYVYLM